MGLTASDFEARVAPLRSLDPKKLARERSKLVLAHGQFLAQFATQALEALPKDVRSGAASPAAQTLRLASCAREAAQLILTLRAFPSPTPEKLCYNVASRCLALGEVRPAAALALELVAALRKAASKSAAAKRAQATPALADACSDGPPDSHAPLGGEGSEACVLAASALGLHLRALELLSRAEPSAEEEEAPTQRMLRAVPLALSWLERLRAADGLSERRENAPKRQSEAARHAAERVLPALTATLAALRKAGAAEPRRLEAWHAAAAALRGAEASGGAGGRLSCPEAAAYAEAARQLGRAAPLSARGEGSAPPLEKEQAEAALSQLQTAARHAGAAALDRERCQALASGLNALYQAFAGRVGPLPMRRLDAEGGAAQPAQLPLPRPLLWELAAAFDRFAAVVDAGVELERGGAAAAAAKPASKPASRPAVFSSLGPKQAAVLVAAAKLRFAYDGAVGASDADAGSLSGDCLSGDCLSRDWVAGVASRLQRAACVVLHGAGAGRSGGRAEAAPRAGAAAADPSVSAVWVARTCQQLAAKLFNASQPRRAACLADCCVEQLRRAAGGGAEEAALLCSAHQIGAHSGLQAKPPAPLEARRHVLAALQIRCAALDAEGGGGAGAAASRPSVRDLCALHVSCLVRGVSEGVLSDDGAELDHVVWALPPPARRLVVRLELEETAQQLGRLREAAAARYLHRYAEAAGRRLLGLLPAGEDAHGRAQLLLRLAEVSRLFASHFAQEAAAADAAAGGAELAARSAALERAGEDAREGLALLGSPAASSGPGGGESSGQGSRGESGGEASRLGADEAGLRLADVKELKVKELKEELQRRGLPASGKKQQLVDRLTEALQQQHAPPAASSPASARPAGSCLLASPSASPPASAEGLDLQARLFLLLAGTTLDLAARGPACEVAGEPAAAAEPDFVALDAARQHCARAAQSWQRLAAEYGAPGGRASSFPASRETASALERCSRLCWRLMASFDALRMARLAVAAAAACSSPEEASARRWCATLLADMHAPWPSVDAALSSESGAPPCVRDALAAEAELASPASPRGAGSSLARAERALTAHAERRGKGDPLLLSRCQSALSRSLLASGAFPLAARHAEQALLRAKQPRSAAHDGDAASSTCRALLALAEMWRARGSYADAHKYAASACSLSAQSRQAALLFESRLAQLRLQCDGMRFEEAAETVSSVEALLRGMRALEAAGGRPPAVTELGEARLQLVQAELLLAREGAGAAQASLNACEAGLRLLAALPSQLGAVLEGLLAEGQTDSAVVPPPGVALLLEAGLTTRAGEAACTLGDLGRARAFVDQSVESCRGLRGTVMPCQPSLVGDVELARALLVSAELRLLARGDSGGDSGGADLRAASCELSSALRLCAALSPPALMRRVCVALAACCTGSHAQAGADLLAGSSGVALRRQLHLLDGRARGCGGQASKPAEGGAGGGAEDGAEDEAEASLADALDAVSLEPAPPLLGEEGGGAVPSLPWPVGFEEWVRAAPAGYSACALAVAPGGRGLLLGSWRTGRPAVVINTSEVGAAGAAGGIEAVKSELRQILEDGRAASSDAAGQAAAAAAAELPRLGASRRPPQWPRAELVPEGEGRGAIVLGRDCPTVVLGRAQEGGGRIDLDEVSSSHCKLTLSESGTLSLTDLSTNGTYVDGVRPKRDRRTAELRDGSRVTLVSKTAQDCRDRFGPLAPSYVVRLAASTPPEGRQPDADAEATARERLERSLYWSSREQLDSRMRELTARLEDALGPAALLLLALPACPEARSAAEALGESIVEQAGRLGWQCDEALLRAAAEASPWLTDERLHRALLGLVRKGGKPVAAAALRAAVQSLRKRWQSLGAPRGGPPAAMGAAGEAAGEGDAAGEGVLRSPLVLVVDESLASLPWECIPSLVEQPVARLPCAAYVDRCAAAADARGGSVASSDAYYLLNPSGDLQRTQAAFKERFARPPWEGVVGEPPAEEALRSALERKDLFVYCGHGDGSRFISADSLHRLPRCSVSVLMGCSSGALKRVGGLAPSGMALSCLNARSPAVVANLWDVTDGESDRFCRALMDSFERGGCLLTAVASARRACRLRYLTGAAAVCYGAPITVEPRGGAEA